MPDWLVCCRARERARGARGRGRQRRRQRGGADGDAGAISTRAPSGPPPGARRVRPELVELVEFVDGVGSAPALHQVQGLFRARSHGADGMLEEGRSDLTAVDDGISPAIELDVLGERLLVHTPRPSHARGRGPVPTSDGSCPAHEPSPAHPALHGQHALPLSGNMDRGAGAQRPRRRTHRGRYARNGLHHPDGGRHPCPPPASRSRGCGRGEVHDVRRRPADPWSRPTRPSRARTVHIGRRPPPPCTARHPPSRPTGRHQKEGARSRRHRASLPARRAAFSATGSSANTCGGTQAPP